MVYYILLSIVYLQYIFHHISPYFTIFHHISPYFTIFHHISPYFTIFHHISSYFTIFHHIFFGFPLFYPFLGRPGELMFGASIFQSPDSSLAAATVVLLPVLLVAFTIYSQSPDLQSGRLPELSASSASSASSPAPPWWLGIFVGFFLGNEPPNSMIWTGKLLYHVVNACFLAN